MSLVIDANMKLFAEKMNITSSRMVNDYGLSTIDEIIEAEAKKGNTGAIDVARDYYSSPSKLIEIFKLTDVENKFVLLHHMDEITRLKVLPLLEQKDLVMGLYFFTKEGLLKMLLKADIEELVRVVMEAFPPEQMILMFSEEDLAMFFMNTELKRVDIMEQLYALPPEMMQKFVEGVTGKPSEQTNTADLFKTIESLPDDQFRKFMASIDPQVQRYVTYQTTKKNPDYFLLFPKMSYVKMMSTLMKPDMVKSMVMLNKESLMYMVAELPPDLLSIVAAQVDPTKLATFLQDGHMDLLEGAWMV